MFGAEVGAAGDGKWNEGGFRERETSAAEAGRSIGRGQPAAPEHDIRPSLQRLRRAIMTKMVARRAMRTTHTFFASYPFFVAVAFARRLRRKVVTTFDQRRPIFAGVTTPAVAVGQLSARKPLKTIARRQECARTADRIAATPAGA